MELLWPVSIESFEVLYKYLSGWTEPEKEKIILQIKLEQWSLIKIFPSRRFTHPDKYLCARHALPDCSYCQVVLCF